MKTYSSCTFDIKTKDDLDKFMIILKRWEKFKDLVEQSGLQNKGDQIEMIIDNKLHEYIQNELDNPESKNNISEDEPEVIILKKIVTDIKKSFKDERRNTMEDKAINLYQVLKYCKEGSCDGCGRCDYKSVNRYPCRKQLLQDCFDWFEEYLED